MAPFKANKPSIKSRKSRIAKWFLKFIIVSICCYLAFFAFTTLYAKLRNRSYIIGGIRIEFCKKKFVRFIGISEEVTKNKQDPSLNNRSQPFVSTGLFYMVAITKWDDENIDLEKYYSVFAMLDSIKVNNTCFYIMRLQSGELFVSNYQYKVDIDVRRTIFSLLGDISIEEIKNVISGIKLEYVDI